jgi:iron complex transport system substrate-binding protein
MRICSFLPSATEILYELGLGDQVVGVTDACDFPVEAGTKTVVVRSVFDASKMNSKDIDDMIVQLVRKGKDVYAVDDNALRKSDPDLIVAQGLCEVCSPHMKELDRAMNILNNRPEVIVLDPHDLDDILSSISAIARKVRREEQGNRIVAELRKRIEYVRSTAKCAKGRPRVLCIEWLDPLFTSGHWVPQMVEISGGVNGISKRGEPSRRMGWSELMEFDADKIVLMPCGYNIDRTLNEVWRLEGRDEWKKLGAVTNREVYATNASPYFSRPGPRTVTGLEVLARIINPELFATLAVPENSFRKLY